jgi:hypothetical protein
MPLSRCQAVVSRCHGIVLRNNKTIPVAQSNRILPKAAARRSALPCQRKPSRFIYRNTIAPNVAAAENAFAVRAAKLRACRSQFKRPLRISGLAVAGAIAMPAI